MAAHASNELTTRSAKPRVTPSQFDQILKSETTKIINQGRDERFLGRIDTSPPIQSPDRFPASSSAHHQQSSTSSSSNRPPSLAPTSSFAPGHRYSAGVISSDSQEDLAASLSTAPVAAAVPQSGPSTMGASNVPEEKRRSIFRGSATVSTPDLARKAKDAANARASVVRTERDEAPITSNPSSPFARTRAPIPSHMQPALSRPLTPSSLMVPSGPSQASRSSAQSHKSARASDVSIGTINSYVHIPFSAVDEDPPPSSVYVSSANPSVLRLALGEFSPKKGRASAGSRGDEESEKSTPFSSTMRRTSRFFRKLGGNSSSSNTSINTKYTNTISAPANPNTAEFSRDNAFSAPPVPSIPPGSSPPPPRPATSSSSAIHASDQSSSIDIYDPSPDERLAGTAALVREPSVSTLHVVRRHSRRRSMRMGSAPSSPNLQSTVGGDSPHAQTQEPSAKGTEETDRLRSELQQWKLNVDGVLGSIGDASGLPLAPSPQSTAKTLSAPTSPVPRTTATADVISAQVRPLSTPVVGSDPLYPVGLEPRRPSWDVTFTESEDFTTHVPSRAFKVPTTIFQSPPEDPFNSCPSPAALAALVDASKEPPSIRLVSPVSAATEMQDNVDPMTLRMGSSIDGLGLQTITESSHSRESSLSSPGPSSPQQSRYWTEFGVPPLSVSSSSPTVGGEFNKKLARQSVVAYLPSRPSMVSKTGSMSSLHSEVGGKGPSSRSQEGSSSAEDGALKTDAPLGAPLEDRAKDFAQRCWDEDVTFLEAKKIAEWLGSTGRLNGAALRSYIDFFDFAGLRLDMAFRRLCEKLYLKAETQQVDRILEQFSRRYFETNPKTVYPSPDVVHAVAYSLLLLNTDLHVVDSQTRMSRAQFLRNTIEAINAQTEEPEVITPGLLFGNGSTTSETDSAINVFGGLDEASVSRKSLDKTLSRTLSRRSGSIQNWKANAKESPASSTSNVNQSSPVRARPSTASTAHSVENSPSSRDRENSNTSGRYHDVELESSLKEMYNAIKAQPIFQPQSSTSDHRASISLTPVNSPYGSWNGLSRNGSRRSGTSTSGSTSSAAFKRSSVRGFGSFLGASSGDFMRSSSPTPSTATTLSDDNLSTAYGVVNSHHNIPTIGFASSLSHTIIREQQEDDAKSVDAASVTDEELALLGPPWAKEGIVYRKHYWESHGKRSKEKSWLQVFVVISQGELRMFRFDSSGSSKDLRGGGGVGGGDWASSAQGVGEVSLAHALCSAMPPPGYSRERPHCFVLTLPGGGSYFFHAGTQDLVGEWVSTCNYWSARLSKEPLTGGVSNMEYGWNRIGSDDDEREEIASIRSAKSGRSGHSRLSHHGSFAATSFSGTGGAITINDWKAPSVPTGTSSLPEEIQLENLRRHVGIVRGELAVHNALRARMIKLYPPRSANLAKASTNWERKSQHLLSELVKWVTYSDNLSSAMRLRALRRGQKEVEGMLEAADKELDVYDADPEIGGTDDVVTESPSSAIEEPASTEDAVQLLREAKGAALLKQRDRRSAEVSTASVADSEHDVFFDPETPTRLEGLGGETPEPTTPVL